MAEPARKLPTFDELYREILALPDGLTGEILGPGWLRTMSRPGGKHSRAARRVLRGLGGSDLLEGGEGWWFDIEREIVFSERLLVPDLAGWRVPEEPDFAEENPIRVRPDWVCEILSRSTQRGDRVIKLPIYASEGVGHVWIVDPEACTVEVYETREGNPVLVATAYGTNVRTLPPFPGEFDVGRLWKNPPKPPGQEREPTP